MVQSIIFNVSRLESCCSLKILFGIIYTFIYLCFRYGGNKIRKCKSFQFRSNKGSSFFFIQMFFKIFGKSINNQNLWSNISYNICLVCVFMSERHIQCFSNTLTVPQLPRCWICVIVHIQKRANKTLLPTFNPVGITESVCLCRSLQVLRSPPVCMFVTPEAV